MLQVAYRQAVSEFEKTQKQVSALEAEAVKALTGESQLDLSVVNAMLLKHRALLEEEADTVEVPYIEKLPRGQRGSEDHSFPSKQ